jgi:hypothetical protein
LFAQNFELRRLARMKTKFLRYIKPSLYIPTLIVAVIVGGYLLFRSSTLDDQARIKIEVIKTLLSLPIILILGGIVSELFKYIDRQREDSKSLAIFREDIRKRLGEAYAGAKRCRRLLRVAGFTEEFFKDPITLTKEHMDAYSNQLEVINEIQLDLEKLWQEVDCFSCAFSSPNALIKRVKVMSGYLRRLIDEYERNWTILQETRTELPLSNLTALRQLTGPTNVGKFREQYCDRYSEAVRIIRQDLLRAKT